MNKLEKQYPIKREKLDETHFFQSILQEAYHLKLLTDSELEDIQLQSIRLLAKQVERYTGGESISVKVETAQSMMQSIFYIIGIYLKSLPDIDMSITYLKQKPVSELYQRGLQLIKEKLDSARRLLVTIQNDGFSTNNIAYNDTIQNGIPVFFSSYDIDFAAHDTPGSIDYPLSNDKMDLVGIEYILNYLRNLFLENRFCNIFPAYDIEFLLQGYDKNYKELLINIFTLVLTNTLGSLLVNKESVQLNIKSVDREYLQRKLANLPKAKLDIILQEASIQLFKKLNVTDSLLQKNVAAVVMDLSTRIKNAWENNCLESIFISFKESQSQQVFQFEENEKMEDKSFRSLLEEIKECRYASDKISLIQREIHSITDLVDVLEGYCIFNDEFTEVFQSLGDMELALLVKKLPTSIIASAFHIMENEKEWHDRLKSFLSELDSTRKKSIEELVERIISSDT